MMLAKVDLANLLYVVGALAAATVVSAIYVLHHRKPRSMESAIESFSRELRALAPDRQSGAGGGGSDRARGTAPQRGDGETG